MGNVMNTTQERETTMTTAISERILHADRAQRMTAIREEEQIEKDWQAAGSPEPRPHLPNLDHCRKAYELKGKGQTMTTTTATKPPTTVNTDTVYLVDGEPVTPSRNMLREVAWFYSAGDDGARTPLKAFRNFLVEQGVEDPDRQVFGPVTLPNGKTLANVKVEDAPKVEPKPKAAKEAKAEPEAPQVPEVVLDTLDDDKPYAIYRGKDVVSRHVSEKAAKAALRKLNKQAA